MELNNMVIHLYKVGILVFNHLLLLYNKLMVQILMLLMLIDMNGVDYKLIILIQYKHLILMYYQIMVVEMLIYILDYLVFKNHLIHYYHHYNMNLY